MSVSKWMAIGALGLALLACGGGSGTESPTPTPEPLPPLSTELALQDRRIVKLRASGNAWMAVAEKPRPHEDNTAPDRHLLVAPPGASAALEFTPPAGWALIDSVLHPSGELSVVLATARQLRLLRLGAQAQQIGNADFVDPLTATDPIFSEGGSSFVHDSSSQLPFATRDAVRIAAAGENLVMALRTGRHAVVAYGLRYAREQGDFTIGWRTLVEPGVAIDAEAYRGGSGTFDPFNGMENQFHVALDVDAAGQVAIGVALTRTELVYGHNRQFNANLPGTLLNGVLLTQLRADGLRLHTTVIDTAHFSELHGLRWIGAQIALVGRVRTRAESTGWDGFVGLVSQGRQTPDSYRLIDIDRSDLLLDVARLPDGRLLFAGSTGYTQNPSGRSVSEEAAPLLAVSAADGSGARRLALTAGARHNQAWTLAQWGGKWWVGGMEDGPGTHTDDADPSRLRSKGFVRALATID
ncbi:hypothetical protein DES47_104393 [Roseateles toxinivorans]|uniref:Delta-60 repeat protein n=1 Tax=Roseateles toxinivorans TaxID=270368 RepID=A0A4R6QMM9_9BURK|nr:hypothetical protein DES47_104393 [Roseateles toxinivorans]